MVNVSELVLSLCNYDNAFCMMIRMLLLYTTQHGALGHYPVHTVLLDPLNLASMFSNEDIDF